MAERDYLYQYMVLNPGVATDNVDINDAAPCPKPTEARGGNTWSTGAVDLRRYSATGLSAGDVRLLCLQTMWEDDNGVSQYGNRSWAWAATTPSGPGVGAETDQNNRTTEITWPTVALEPGFNYVFALASAPADRGVVADTQAVCNGGRSLDTETTDVSVSVAYPVPAGRLDVYTSNRLCYRVESPGVGMSEWAIGGAVTTLPQHSERACRQGPVAGGHRNSDYLDNRDEVRCSAPAPSGRRHNGLRDGGNHGCGPGNQDRGQRQVLRSGWRSGPIQVHPRWCDLRQLYDHAGRHPK